MNPLPPIPLRDMFEPGRQTDFRMDSRTATWALRLLEALLVAAVFTVVMVLLGFHKDPWFPAVVGILVIARFLYSGFRHGFGFHGAGRASQARRELDELHRKGPPYDHQRLITLFLRSLGVTREDPTPLTHARITAFRQRFGVELPRLWIADDVRLDGLHTFVGGNLMHRIRPTHRLLGLPRHWAYWIAILPVFGAILYATINLGLPLLTDALMWLALIAAAILAPLIRSIARGQGGRWLVVSKENARIAIAHRQHSGAIKDFEPTRDLHAYILVYRHRGAISQFTDDEGEDRLRMIAPDGATEIKI